jgi:hypothetical protein
MGTSGAGHNGHLVEALDDDGSLTGLGETRGHRHAATSDANDGDEPSPAQRAQGLPLGLAASAGRAANEGASDLMSHATILCSPQITPLDVRVSRLTEFLGIESTVQTVGGAATSPPSEPGLLDRDHHCLMLSAASLGSLLESSGNSSDLLPRLLSRTRYLFVYGFHPTASDNRAVRHLTRGLVNSVVSVPPGNHQYAISSDWRALTREFTGLAFGSSQPAVDAAFSGASLSAAVRPIVSIGGLATFASVTLDACTVFILACGDIADLDAKVQGEFPVVEWFSRVIPALMFMRFAFGDDCWYGSRPGATFIIDDPLLRESYGFLNYRRLLQAIGDQPFSTSIAFIPVNYRRSQASVVDLFRARPDRLSLCVHGCDHTGGEFATTDLAVLNAMTRLASERMKAQENATGLGYDRIMVFPQGRFSVGSLKALRCNDFMAAVNTSPIPEDSVPGGDLTMREWLDVAITRHYGFPLFVRRYPRRLVDFAFDLFLGKPLLVAEHHTAFRNGYGEIAAFVAALNGLNADLAWAGLGETLSRACLRRQFSKDTVYTRIWTNHHVIENETSTSKRYIVVKSESTETPIRHVTVEDQPVDFVIEEGLMKLAVDVPPRAARVIRVTYSNSLPMVARRVGLRTRLAIQGRRRLSEFRDNVLSRQERLLTLHRVAARRLSG